MMARSSNDVLVNIQILRFVAAALVVFSHAVDLSSKGVGTSYLSYGNFENFGAVGVDVFFVISGFIIARTGLLVGNKSAWRFAVNRFKRVAPIYYLLSIPWIVLALKAHAPASVWISTFFFWPAAGSDLVSPALPVGWTLCFEMLFYLGGAIFLAFPNRKIAAVMLLAAYTAAWGLNRLTHLSWFQILGNPIILEFLCGVAIARLERALTVKTAKIVGAIGITWLLSTILTGYGDISESRYTLDSSLSFTRFMVWGVPSAMLVVAAVGSEQGGDARSRRVLRFLGDASYSTYLVHLSLFVLLAKILTQVDVNRDVIIVIATVSGVAVGAAVFQWVERPMMAWLSSKQKFHFSQRLRPSKRRDADANSLTEDLA